MKLQDIERKFPPFDKPAGEGAYLLDTKKFVQVFPTATPKQTGTLTWTAARGPAVADTEFPPAIFFSGCSACRSEAGYIKGPTAHLTGKIWHCGFADTVPAHVAEQYVKLCQDFKRRQERKRATGD